MNAALPRFPLWITRLPTAAVLLAFATLPALLPALLPAQSGYQPYADSAAWKPITRLPARAGDGCPDLALTDILTSRTTRLSDYRGKVLYLDFWATWCPSCLPILGTTSDTIRKRQSDWNSRVAVVGINLDEKIRTARRAVESNGWTTMTHLWSDMDLSGREKLASKAFGIIELPYALLVDTSGTIVWRGNPAHHSMEQAVDRLLAR